MTIKVIKVMLDDLVEIQWRDPSNNTVTWVRVGYPDLIVALETVYDKTSVDQFAPECTKEEV
jgi:hypothetical protein